MGVGVGTVGMSERIVTSRITKVKGRSITTSTGSVYRLAGRAYSPFRDWCAGKGYKCIGHNPLVDIMEYL